MFKPYLAQEAKAAADTYYQPLNQLFDYVKENATKGMYSLLVSGTQLNEAQISFIKKCGYTVEVQVDEKDSVRYNISWNI